MTIHKSKGLEFRAVLIPFCDWKLDHDASKPNFLWCKGLDKPYSDMGYLPVKYHSDLANSYFKMDYFTVNALCSRKSGMNFRIDVPLFF